MSEQQTPPEPEGTTPDTPEQGTEQQQEVDWQKRYTDLQPEYTRTTQELSELRKQQDDLDYFRELATKHGYQLEEDDETNDDTQFDDPNEQLASEVEQMKAYLAAQQQEQQQEQQLNRLEASVEQQLEELPAGLTEKQKDWIVSRAIALPATEQGLPDITAAHKEFEALRLEDQQQWSRTKRAPHISPNGQAATQQKNVVDMTRQERQDWMAEQLQANEQ